MEDRQGGGGSGQPSWSLPSAAVKLSDLQHPYKVSLQGVTGQPAPRSPVAGDTSSGQHPNLDSWQVLGFGQPKRSLYYTVQIKEINF